jgi:hypothetical protein
MIVHTIPPEPHPRRSATGRIFTKTKRSNLVESVSFNSPRGKPFRQPKCFQYTAYKIEGEDHA